MSSSQAGQGAKSRTAYWVNLQGHNNLHPTKVVLIDCWEHQESDVSSFGWVGNAKAIDAGLNLIQISPTVVRSFLPGHLLHQ